MLIFFRGRNNPLFAVISIILLGVLTVGALFGIIFLFLFAALCIILYPLISTANRRRYGSRPGHSQQWYVETPDGWHLPVYVHRPEKRTKKLPVILCHGLAANHRSYDLEPGSSLAAFLNRAGYQVYSVDMRGCGRSYHDSDWPEPVFSDLAGDVALFIDRVLHHDRSEKVIWIGHSLGAMVMYRHLMNFPKGMLRNPKLPVAAFVSLAGPPDISLFDHPVIWDYMKVRKFLRHIDLPAISLFFSPFGGRLPTRYDDFLYNRNAISGDNLRKFMAYGVSDISHALLDEMMNAIRSGASWFDFSRISIPVLMMTGSLDQLCRVDDMQSAFRELPKGRRNRFHILGRNSGFSVNYCHASILMGKNSAAEVFPLIRRFIDAI